MQRVEGRVRWPDGCLVHAIKPGGLPGLMQNLCRNAAVATQRCIVDRHAWSV
jgi:hypothetical protein